MESSGFHTHFYGGTRRSAEQVSICWSSNEHAVQVVSILMSALINWTSLSDAWAFNKPNWFYPELPALELSCRILVQLLAILTCTQLFEVSLDLEFVLFAKATSRDNNIHKTYYLNGFCLISCSKEIISNDSANVTEIGLKSF